jgi:hypothetical protein
MPGCGRIPREAKGKQSDTAAFPPKEGSKSEEAAEECWWAPGPEDLVIEGEEGEYFPELLMREETLEESALTESMATQPAKKETQKSKTANSKGKKKGKGKSPKGGKEAIVRPEEEETRKRAGGRQSEQVRVTPPDPLVDPEDKDRGLQTHGQPGAGPGAKSATTSRRECSGQEKPES